MRTRCGHVLWTALLLIAGGGPAAGRLCRDGWGMQGACVSLRSCDSMQQLIRSRPSSDDIARIKASICQTEGGLIVCCALPTTTTTTTTTTQAPLDLSKFDPNTPEGNPKRLLLPRDCGMLVDERIVGGEEAQLGGHPWLALLGFKDTNTYDNYYNYYDDEAAAPAAETEPKVKFSCGAALINNRYVVTAAHCIPKPGESGEILKIRLGEHDLKTEVDCRSMGTDQATGVEKKECNEPPVDIAIERITNHPQFDRPVKNMNDIALIRLAKPVNFTKWITPICLPFEQWRTAELPNDKAIAAGFGLTKAFGDTSPTLQELTVPLVDLNICKTIFARMRARLSDTQMCAGGNVGQDSCEGDSGGPLIMHDRFGPPYHLVGITSFGSQSCGVGATPGVYTRVSQYMDWILQNIAP